MTHALSFRQHVLKIKKQENLTLKETSERFKIGMASERFNRTVRQECLDRHQFISVKQAQHIIEDWLWTYNNERPNMALAGITPAMKIKQFKSENVYL